MIFSRPAADVLLGQERLAEFQRARATYLRAEDVRLSADEIAEKAKGEYESAKKALRRIAEQ